MEELKKELQKLKEEVSELGFDYGTKINRVMHEIDEIDEVLSRKILKDMETPVGLSDIEQKIIGAYRAGADIDISKHLVMGYQNAMDFVMEHRIDGTKIVEQDVDGTTWINANSRGNSVGFAVFYEER